jgi:hypothetical protein
MIRDEQVQQGCIGKDGNVGLLRLSSLLVLATTICALATAQKASDSSRREIEQFLAHPLFLEPYSCSEHAAGELPYLGDDLGQDCMIEAFVERNGRAFMRAYATDGLTNEDWYGWNKVVLSPCDCTVTAVDINPTTNVPGQTGKPPASSIELLTADGISVVLAHIQSPLVKKGDVLKSGEPVAHVGNNGYSRVPHIHIGAWRERDGLQIRWDQKKIPIP